MAQIVGTDLRQTRPALCTSRSVIVDPPNAITFVREDVLRVLVSFRFDHTRGHSQYFYVFEGPPDNGTDSNPWNA